MSLKVVKLVAENYKALKGRTELDLPNGASFYLFAGNGQGKTSLGGALADMLTKTYPSHPITEGEHEGFIEVTFSDGSKAYTKFTDGKKPVLEIITAEGHEIGSPRDLIKELTGDGMSFEIDDLFRLAPKELREKMQKIANLDLRQLDARYKKAFDDRTDANRRLKDQLAKVKPFDEKEAEKEPGKMVSLLAELTELEKQANVHEAAGYRLESLKSVKTNLQEELDNLMILVENKKLEIKDNADLIKKGEKWLKENKAPEAEAIQAKRDEIDNIEETNKGIAEAKRLKAEFDLSVELQKEADRLDELVNSIVEEKKEAIKAAPLPATGMTFDTDGSLLLNGLPFEDNQIAHSAKVIAGVEIAASMLGKIKFLHFDAAPLDKANIERIFKYGEEIGLQLCVEYPLFEGGGLRMELHEGGK